MEALSLTLRDSSHPLLSNNFRRGLICPDSIILPPNSDINDYIIQNDHFSFVMLSLKFPSKPSYFIQAIIVDTGNVKGLMVTSSFPIKEQLCSCTIVRPIPLLLQTIIIQPQDEDSLEYSLQSK